MMAREQDSRTRPPLEEIDRYLAGELSPEAEAQVRAWADEGENRALMGALTSGWAPPVSGSVDLDQAWRAMAGEALRPVRVLQLKKSAARSKRRVSFARHFVALTGLVAMMSAVGVWHVMQTEPHTIFHEYATRRAQTGQIRLPDGSRVHLAPETQVRYTTDAEGTRTIALHGQAYFSIVPDPTRTFLVRTPSTTTRVLGTAFGVRQYKEDSVAEVAVTEGKVALTTAVETTAVETTGRQIASPVLLASGMLAQAADSGITVNSNADTRAATAWKDGHLVFNDVPVRVVLASAGRWCGYEFRLADTTMASQHVTTVITVGDRIRTMQALKDLLDVTMTFNGATVTLTARDSVSSRRLREPKIQLSTSTQFGK